MNSEELKARTKAFGLRVMKVVDVLPGTASGRALGAQLIRGGTSVGANYRSACRGRSTAEFTAKLGIVIEEADESAYWLELIAESEMLKPALIQPLIQEASELVAILTAAVKTTKAKSRSPDS
jgi:four helix bundle protein